MEKRQNIILDFIKKHPKLSHYITKRVRKCTKRYLFSTANLRTRKTLGKSTKKPQNCGFIYFGRAICAIHELILFIKFCCLGKMLKHFYKIYDIIILER